MPDPVTPPDRPDADGPRRRPLAHDHAGEPYPTAMSPMAASDRPARAAEAVASRTTEEEARDLLALRHAKRGDTGAFADLLQANDRDVRAFLAALVGVDDLDAVVTQVYLRAFRGLPIAPPTSPRIWLLGIADGAARDVARRARQHAGTDPLDAPIPLELPDEERLVLAAVEAVGLTRRETARLVAGGLESVQELLTSGRRHPGVALPLEPAPDHGPRFWEDLGRRLLIERSAPAASGRPRTREANRPPPEADEVTPSTPTALAARGMARRVEQQNPRSVPWRRIGVAAALLVGVAAVVGVALTIAGQATRRDAGLGETAIKTLNQLDAALARNTVVRGTVQIEAPGSDVLADGEYLFVRSNTGSWHLSATDDSLAEGYDVASATAAVVRPSREGRPGSATVRTGLAPGPPEATGVAVDTPGDVLANVIRAVRGGSSGRVATREVPVEDADGSADGSGDEEVATRSVWVVTSDLDDGIASSALSGAGNLGEIDADSAELVADRSLALPTQLTLRRDGEDLVRIRFGDLSISQQPATSSYAPTVPAGVQADRSDAGFEPVAAGELTATGTRGVATPSYLPGGYVLAAAGVHPSGTTVVCYRNGSRQLVLTTRPSPPADERASDPFSHLVEEEGADAEPESVEISSGVLAGSDAYASEREPRHVWVNGPRFQAIAAGDPPMAQLVDVVSSLR